MSKAPTHVEVIHDGSSLGTFTLRQAAAKAGIHPRDLANAIRRNAGYYVTGRTTFAAPDAED